MNNRYLGAVLLSPLILVLFVGGAYLKYTIMVLALMGMYEFYKVVKVKNIHSISIIGYIMCITYYVSLENVDYKYLFLFITLTLLILLCVPVIDLKYTFIDIACTLLGFLYVAVFFSFIPLTYLKPYGGYLVWLIFISCWLCDTCAYYVGKNLGKKKLCPKVSPKKTLEGSIGGLIGSIISCGILGIIFIRNGVNIPIYHYLIIGALCGVFAQFGDLIASSIKRYAGVKDYSNLIPGHGGILDRFDSILFSSVVVYFYITFVLFI